MKKILFALAIALSALFAFSSTKALAFTAGPVGRNQVRAYPGPGKGEVTLQWQRYFPSGENFTVHYGTKSNTYPYTASHIGYVSTLTVRSLTPGTRYFFTVEGILTGDVPAGWDGEVSAVAPTAPVTVTGSSGPIGRNLLIAKSGPKSGQVTLSWRRINPDTEAYNVVYGVIPGKYIYGAMNAVTTTPQNNQYSYVVDKLQSGKKYYFALIPQRSGTTTYTTTEVTAVAR